MISSLSMTNILDSSKATIVQLGNWVSFPSINAFLTSCIKIVQTYLIFGIFLFNYYKLLILWYARVYFIFVCAKGSQDSKIMLQTILSYSYMFLFSTATYVPQTTFHPVNHQPIHQKYYQPQQQHRVIQEEESNGVCLSKWKFISIPNMLKPAGLHPSLRCLFCVRNS